MHFECSKGIIKKLCITYKLKNCITIATVHKKSNLQWLDMYVLTCRSRSNSTQTCRRCNHSHTVNTTYSWDIRAPIKGNNGVKINYHPTIKKELNDTCIMTSANHLPLVGHQLNDDAEKKNPSHQNFCLGIESVKYLICLYGTRLHVQIPDFDR